MRNILISLTAALMLTMAASAQTGGSLWWGYCHEPQVPDNYLGVSKVAVYEAAIHVDGLDGVIAGTTIEAVRLPFCSVEHIDSLTLWLTTSLDGEERLLTVPVDNVAEGWNVVRLAEPVAIPAEGLYIGYTFKVTELDGQSERPLVMCNDLNDGGLWLRVASVRQYREWYNTRRYGSLALQLLLTGGSLQAHNADVDAIRSWNVVRSTDDQIDVMFTNRGTEPIMLTRTSSLPTASSPRPTSASRHSGRPTASAPSRRRPTSPSTARRATTSWPTS